MSYDILKDVAEFEGVLYFTHDPERNAFYDECGFRIVDILQMITPSQLYMFRHAKRNVFPCRFDPKILIYIFIEED
jgi:hypothetical protein